MQMQRMVSALELFVLELPLLAGDVCLQEAKLIHTRMVMSVDPRPFRKAYVLFLSIHVFFGQFTSFFRQFTSFFIILYPFRKAYVLFCLFTSFSVNSNFCHFTHVDYFTSFSKFCEV